MARPAGIELEGCAFRASCCLATIFTHICAYIDEKFPTYNIYLCMYTYLYVCVCIYRSTNTFAQRCV